MNIVRFSRNGWQFRVSTGTTGGVYVEMKINGCWHSERYGSMTTEQFKEQFKEQFYESEDSVESILQKLEQ